MKKFLLFFACLFVVPSMLIFSDGDNSYSTYTVKKIEVNSSSDNPGKLNVSTSFERKDKDGNVVKDSKNDVVDVSNYNGYEIKMNDNDAGYSIEEPVFDNSEFDIPDFQNFDDIFAERLRRNNRVFQQMRERMNRFNDDFFYDDSFNVQRSIDYPEPVETIKSVKPAKVVKTRKARPKRISIPRLFFLF